MLPARFPQSGGVQVLDGGMQVGTSDLLRASDGPLSSVLVRFAGRSEAHDDGRAENRLDDRVVIQGNIFNLKQCDSWHNYNLY